MPYKHLDKKQSLMLLLLGWGLKDALKYGSPEEVKEAKKQLAKLGWKYGRCEQCGEYWFIKRLRYRVRKAHSKTWLTFTKILCPSCRGKILRQARKSILTEVLKLSQRAKA